MANSDAPGERASRHGIAHLAWGRGGGGDAEGHDGSDGRQEREVLRTLGMTTRGDGDGDDDDGGGDDVLDNTGSH